MKILRNFLILSKETVSASKSFFDEYYKIFSKPVFFLVILFCVALIPLFQAHVNYVDDAIRALNGNRDWAQLHSRWTSEYLSILIHSDSSLRDISPFPQLIAVFLISLASIFLCWIVFEKKLTKTGILTSALLGLGPFFLGCIAFKFDSPYMALSILASIFPFLFAFKNQKLFAAVSFFCLLLMLTTYQFSSGIYIMVGIFLVIQSWNDKSKSVKELLNFSLIAALSYISALIFFRIFLLQTQIFRSNTIFKINEMPLGILKNFKNNFESIINDFNILWIWLLAIIIIMFVAKSVILSKQNKALSLLVNIAGLVLLFFFIRGFFIFVDNIGSSPRYLIGFNALITSMALYLAKQPYKFFSTPALILLYCFFIFAFAFGNALEYQKQYKTFFATMLIDDLSKIVTNDEVLKEKTNIHFAHPIGDAPGVKTLKKDYPIIGRLIPNDFGKHTFGYTNLEWYNFPAPQPKEMSKEQKQQVNESPILIDSYYYTIRKNNSDIYIRFSNR